MHSRNATAAVAVLVFLTFSLYVSNVNEAKRDQIAPEGDGLLLPISFFPYERSCTTLQDSPMLAHLRHISQTLQRPLSFLQGPTRCFPHLDLHLCIDQPDNECLCSPGVVPRPECVPELTDWTHLLAKTGSQPPRYHLLLISTDTTRADILTTSLGLAPGVTGNASTQARFPLPLPKVAELMRDASHPALFFGRHTTNAPWTRPSHGASLTGWSSEMSGIMDEDHVLKVPQIAHHLQQLGMPSFGYVDNPNLNPDQELDLKLLAQYNQGRKKPIATTKSGYKSFGWHHERNTPHKEWILSPQSAQLATERLRKLTIDEPSVVFYHTNAIHVDPEQYHEAPPKLDQELSQVLSAIRWDETIVVWTSDHGQGLEPERGRLGHGGRLHRDLTDGIFAMWLPPALRQQYSTAFAHGVSYVPTQSLDLVPTILDLYGMERSHIPFLGENALVRAENKHNPRDFPLSVADDRHNIFCKGKRDSVTRHEQLEPGGARVDEVNLRMELAWPMKWVLGAENGLLAVDESYNLLYDPYEEDNLARITPHAAAFAASIDLIVPSACSSWRYHMQRSELHRATLRSITAMQSLSACTQAHWDGRLLVQAIQENAKKNSEWLLLVETDVWFQDGFLSRLASLADRLPSHPESLVLSLGGVIRSRSYMRQVREHSYEESGWESTHPEVVSADALDSSVLLIRHPSRLGVQHLHMESRTTGTRRISLSGDSQQAMYIGDGLVFLTDPEGTKPGYTF